MLPTLPRPSVFAIAGAVLLLAVGCGGGTAAVATPSPTAVASATPSPTPTPTPRPSPTPTQEPSPTPSAATSLIAELKIGAPYELVDNPANTALHATFNFQMGSIAVTETMTGREVHQRATLVGFAYVLEISGVPMNDAAFEGGARGAAANTQGTLSYTKILGHKVALVVAKTASFGMYLHDDAIIMVGAESLNTTKALLTSVIKANP